MRLLNFSNHSICFKAHTRLPDHLDLCISLISSFIAAICFVRLMIYELMIYNVS
jgi:hypothetical protein